MHHHVRLGVFEYAEITLLRADGTSAWTVGWQLQALRLLATVSLTVPLLWYGRHSIQRLDRVLVDEAKRRP